uniref:Inactive hydroxysteroid dehydrogenase-like protein 1 n=2 Tax=Hirondellea gigas TaxID=1518452 RepID=A0A2P2I3Z9_9CRUS
MPSILSVPVRALGTVDSFGMLFSQYSSNFKTLDDILAVIGLIFVGRIALSAVWNICVGIRSMFWSRLWKKNFEKRYGGKWAVVTGCTDGIGKAYCHELAKDGLNIVLISRSMDKLNAVAEELKSQHGVETEVVQANFVEGETLYPRIDKHLQGKEISVLINNVGVMISHPKYYDEVTDFEMWSHINVNMASMAVMTKLILPGMLKKNKGAIVNIASIAATGPIPLLGIYAASKAFVEFLSLSMNSEYYWGHRGITIQTVTPAYVSTNMTSFSKWTHTPNPATPTPAQFAASAVSTIGYTDFTTGFWAHGIMKWIVDLMPRAVYMTFMKMQHMFLRSTVKNLHTS